MVRRHPRRPSPFAPLTPVVLGVVLLALVGNPSEAVAQPSGQPAGDTADGFHGYEDLRWRSIRRPKVGPQEALLDHRSPVVPHETKVELEQEFELFGHKLTFELARGRLKVTHQEPDSDRPRTGTLGRLPALMELEREDEEPYGISIRLNAAGDQVWISSIYAMEIRVGRDTCYLVDSDRDGQLGSRNDGVVVPGARTVAAFQGEVWTATGGVGLRFNAEDELWETAELPMPTRDRNHSAAWCQLNWRRQQAGVNPLQYDDDEKLIEAMELHAAYCARYGKEVREEPDEEEAGYTKEGATVAPECVVLTEVATYEKGLEDFLRQAFQRSELLSGALTKTTFVLHNQALLINTRRHRKGQLRPVPVIWPPHGAEDVDRAFRRDGETPMPVLEPARGNTCGNVVGLHLFTLEKTDKLPEAPELVVSRIDERGRPQAVAGTLHYPGELPDPDSEDMPKSYWGNVFFIPERNFPGATEFTCRLKLQMPDGALVSGGQTGETFEYEWTFRTK